MLSDIISRGSAACWLDVREQLKKAWTFRQYVLDYFDCKNAMTAVKEKTQHVFLSNDDALMIFSSCREEIIKLVPEEFKTLADRQRGS